MTGKNHKYNENFHALTRGPTRWVRYAVNMEFISVGLTFLSLKTPNFFYTCAKYKH